ncbi:MAG: hypothetical protein ACRCXA_04910 [Peptostreptococcaceae bacterium]
MNNSNKTNGDKYLNWTHKYGRIGLFIAILYLLAIPTIICIVYDCFPSVSDVIKGGIGVLALYVPIAIAEVISYTPILGSSCYITFLTGNILNLKLPCVINAMKIANVESNTVEGDAISTVAVAASSILTILIIAIGVIFLVPLQPLLQSDMVQTATKYMLPALFGGMFLGFMGKGDGEYIVENKLLSILIPIIIVSVGCISNILIPGVEGIIIIVMLPVTLISARVLWKKGIIRVVKNSNKEDIKITD